MWGACRVSSHHYCNPHQLGVYTTKNSFNFSSSSSFILAPPSQSLNLVFPSPRKFFRVKLSNTFSVSSSAANNSDDLSQVSFSHTNNFIPDSSRLSDCLSPVEDGQEPPSEGLSSVAGGIVALGKFDALHIGHRELAIHASKVGAPFLLSFIGMAEILGWEPRAPIVAKCDRKRVLSSWAPLCGGDVPREVQVDFSKVRYLTPQQFVEKLSKDLGVRGVVAGQNYRFGYRASGDASDLVRLCRMYGMGAYIINTVMDNKQIYTDLNASNSKEHGQVSSTRVRHALASGDMCYVSELLGRHHRLMLMLKDKVKSISDMRRLSAPRSCFLNLPPKEGLYRNCSLLIGEKHVIQCRVIIDMTCIHLELDDIIVTTHVNAQELELLGIDFLGSIA